MQALVDGGFDQPRQSSITRPTSAQAGITSGRAPGCSTVKRPRLNAIASSSGSLAASVAPTPPAGVGRVAIARTVLVVRTVRPALSVAPSVRDSVTCRGPRAHCRVNSAAPALR